MNSRRKLIANIKTMHYALSEQQAEATQCKKAIINNQYLTAALGISAAVIALFVAVKTPQTIKNLSHSFWNITKLTAFNYIKRQLLLW